jgi:hypothetical protein
LGCLGPSDYLSLDTIDFYLKTIDAMTEPFFDCSEVVFGGYLFANLRDIACDRGKSFFNNSGECVDYLLKCFLLGHRNIVPVQFMHAR